MGSGGAAVAHSVGIQLGNHRVAGSSPLWMESNGMEGERVAGEVPAQVSFVYTGVYLE